MISLKEIKGQSNAVRLLSNSLKKLSFSKSYLFSGPDGVGKGLTVKAFLLSILCPEKDAEHMACLTCPVCKRIAASEHPDIHWIKPEKNKSIKIDDIRSLRDSMNLKPYEAILNAGIIEDAHLMTEEAQNALLKVLEEPPGNSILVLITNKKELLLPTVVSRCAEVRFSFLSIKETTDIVTKNLDLEPSSIEVLSYFSQGSPGTALKMVEEGVLARKKELISLIEDIVKEEAPYCLNWDSENRDVLFEDIEMVIMFLRDVLFGIEGYSAKVLDRSFFQTGIYRHFSKYNAEKIYKIVVELIKVKKALFGNANPKIVSRVLPGILMG